ncbi:MAG: FtsQ-type POTRA domain-containing protein [Clostridiales bacterium]|nr:FtsQ-type POTRA domain-containing protein [Clostridiales bacterium]
MKHQKIFSLIITIVFVIVILACAILTFSIKEINLNFSTTEKLNEDTLLAQEEVDEYLNKNLLFFNTKKIEKTLEKYTYFDIISVRKSFPNKIEVEIKERQEGYFVKYGENCYVLDVEGFCLKQVDASYDTAELVEVLGVKFVDVQVGKKVCTENEEVFDTALKMAKSVNVGNCIKQMTVYDKKDNEAVLFKVRTDVGVLIRKIKDDGVKKTQEAFSVYDYMTDYQKSYAWLDVYKLDATGEIAVYWTSQSELASYIESLEGLA